MKRIDPRKMIGLVRNIADGSWEPTTESSRRRLHALYAIVGVPAPYATIIRAGELALLKDWAKAAGLRVVTTIKAVRS